MPARARPQVHRLTDAIAGEIGRPVDHRPVEGDGAGLLAELL